MLAFEIPTKRGEYLSKVKICTLMECILGKRKRERSQSLQKNENKKLRESETWKEYMAKYHRESQPLNLLPTVLIPIVFEYQSYVVSAKIQKFLKSIPVSPNLKEWVNQLVIDIFLGDADLVSLWDKSFITNCTQRQTQRVQNFADSVEWTLARSPLQAYSKSQFTRPIKTLYNSNSKFKETSPWFLLTGLCEKRD